MIILRIIIFVVALVNLLKTMHVLPLTLMVTASSVTKDTISTTQSALLSHLSLDAQIMTKVPQQLFVLDVTQVTFWFKTVVLPLLQTVMFTSPTLTFAQIVLLDTLKLPIGALVFPEPSPTVSNMTVWVFVFYVMTSSQDSVLLETNVLQTFNTV